MISQEEEGIISDETSQRTDASKVVLRKSYFATSGLLAFCVVFFFGWSLFLLTKLRNISEPRAGAGELQ
jgi:hypothetical protein